MKINNLNAYYGSKQILNNLSFSLNQGEFTCIIGPNGCGKSTLLKILSNIEQYDLKSSGEITIDNSSIHTLSRKQLSQKVSFMTQAENSVWNVSVKDLILTGRYSHTDFSRWYSNTDKEIVSNIIQDFHLEHLHDRSVNSLSGGEFQRVRIARSIAQESKFVLLDEPIANLDFTCQHDIMKILQSIAKEKNIGVVMAIHDLNLASLFADRIIIVKPIANLTENENQIQFGSVEEVFTPKIMQSLYGKSADIFEHPILHKPQIYINL